MWVSLIESDEGLNWRTLTTRLEQRLLLEDVLESNCSISSSLGPHSCCSSFSPPGCTYDLMLFLFSRSAMSNSFWPHGLQLARPPCPSPAPELTQTHVHRVSDAIQPSHPLSSPSPPALNLSQHQRLLQWVSSSSQVAKGLALQPQHQSFRWVFGADFP